MGASRVALKTEPADPRGDSSGKHAKLGLGANG